MPKPITASFAAALLTLMITVPADAGTVFQVTNTDDEGAGSLRQAIVDANANAGADRIEFDIPQQSCSSAGVCMISLLSALPAVTDAVTIDGTTQPRYGSAPDNVCAGPGDISYMRVELAGNTDITGLLTLEGDEPSVVRGLSIGGARRGVLFASQADHWVHCNHIGVNAEGTAANGITDDAVCYGCFSLAGGGVLGTNGDGVDDVSERNVIAAGVMGVDQNAYANFTVAGNYFGLGADGIVEIDVSFCIFARQSARDNTWGSNLDGLADRDERNVLGACGTGFLIDTSEGNGNNTIAGNWIGLNAAGNPVGVNEGIVVEGATEGLRITGNRIEGAVNAALLIEDDATVAADSDDNCIAGNDVGLDHSGTEPTLDVTNNWWGDASGPSGVGPGAGDAIVEAEPGSVVFDPWLTAIPTSCTDEFLIRDNVQGAWFEPSSAGQGIYLDYLTGLNALTVAWFTFEAASAKLGATDQRWLTALLQVEGDVASGSIVNSTGGVFDTPTLPGQTNTEVGTMTIEFDACDSAILSYELPDEGLSGQIPIQPLGKAVDPGFSCD